MSAIGISENNGGRFTMYSPASERLVIRNSEEEIARFLDAIEAATGFDFSGPRLYEVFSVCAQAPLQPFPLRWEVAHAIEQHIMAKITAAAKRRK
jgi:hypothetical protein